MSLATVLLIVLLLMLLGAVPVWPHSRGYGVYPAGGLTLLIVVLLALILLGHL